MPRTTCVYAILQGLVPALAALTLASCDSGSTQGVVGVTGLVTDASGAPAAGATVFAVPASSIDTTTPMPASSIRDGKTDGVDEPLEDAIERNGKRFPSAQTDGEGRFSLGALPVAGSYFVYVAPATEDEVLPGGSFARRARPARELASAPLAIRLSSRPRPEAVVIGSAACLSCHAEHAGWKRTPHALGVTALDQRSALQDFDLAGAGWRAGVLAAFPESGTRTVYFTPKVVPDAGQADDEHADDEHADEGHAGEEHGADNYLARETEPQSWAFKAILSREAGVPVMSLVDNPASAVVAPSLQLSVSLVMGGQGTTQRFLARVAAPGNPAVTAHFGLPFKVQFEGDEAADTADGTRGYFRGDHAARWVALDESGDVTAFKVPGAKSSFEASCAACHVLDYRLDRDASGFFTAQAFPSTDGIPYGASGERRELNVGCEVCHGPGSDHQSASKSRPGAFIVSPRLLSAEREVQICTQCHSRIRSNDTFDLGTRQPIGREPGRENRLMRPGTRRAEWFRHYVKQRDAEASLIWEDDLHSAHPHQQASDYVKSAHYRNRAELVACSSCHSLHARGPAGWARGARPGEVAKPSSVCLACHSGSLEGVAEHDRHRDLLPSACESCHQPRTARDGAGRPGLPGSVHGTEGRFWEGDLSSHVFDVPRRANPGVVAEGKTPATAMPIPYTNRCGTCHVPALGAGR